MAENVVINIEANTSGLTETINLLTKLGVVEKSVAEEFQKTNAANVSSIQKGVQNTTKEFEKLDKAVKEIGKDNGLAKAFDVSKDVVKLGNSIKQIASELKIAESEANKLVQEFGSIAPESILAASKVDSLAKQLSIAKKETSELAQKFGVGSNEASQAANKVSLLSSQLKNAKKDLDDTVKKFGEQNVQAKGAADRVSLLKAQLQAASLNTEGATKSIGSLNSQLKAATEEAKQLAKQFGIDDERARAAARAANELKSEISNINAQISALTPEGKFQAIANLGGAIQGVFQVATGALQAFGVESETATKLAQQFQGAINIAQGAASIAQLKDAFTAAKTAIGVTTAAQVTQTAVTEAQTVANKGATTTQLELNLAVLANPYVLAAAAVAGLVAALVIYANTASDAERRQQALTKSIQDARVAAAESITEEVTQINLLVEQYQRANTTQEQRKKIAEELNSIAPETLGWFDAEGNALVNLNDKTKNLTESLLRQAQARAIVDEIARLELENQKLRIKGAEGEVDLWDKITAGIQRYGSVGDIVYSLATKSTIASTANAKAQERVNEKLKDNEVVVKGLKGELDKLGGASDALAETNTKTADKIVANNNKIIKSTKETKKQIIPDEPLRELQQRTSTTTVKLEGVKETTQGLAGLSNAFKENVEIGKNWVEQIEDEEDAIKKLKEQLAFEGATATLDTIFSNIATGLEDQIKVAEGTRDAQLELIQEEEDALLNSYEQRRIGKRQLEEEQKKLALERIAAEKKAEKELNELKRKQDVATRIQALFDIAVGTAKNIVTQPGITGALIPYWIALGGIQAAAVLAKPLPKYKKGTLSVGGVGTDDSQLALLQPGEAVIPTETNRKYHPAIKAIYNNKIRPEDINAFVKMRLKGDIGDKSSQALTAKMDTSDLYALGRIMKKNNGVYVTNMGDLAAAFASLNNPRR